MLNYLLYNSTPSLTFLMPAYPGCPGKEAVKRVCMLKFMYSRKTKVSYVKLQGVVIGIKAVAKKKKFSIPVNI